MPRYHRATHSGIQSSLDPHRHIPLALYMPVNSQKASGDGGHIDKSTAPAIIIIATLSSDLPASEQEGQNEGGLASPKSSYPPRGRTDFPYIPQQATAVTGRHLLLWTDMACSSSGLPLRRRAEPFRKLPPYSALFLFSAQELYSDSRGGRPGLPVRNKPDGFYGRKATLKQARGHNYLRSCVIVEVAVLGSPSLINLSHGFCGRKTPRKKEENVLAFDTALHFNARNGSLERKKYRVELYGM